MPDSGLLLVLSGPSGVGKTSLARQVLAQVDGLFSVSVTTRPQSPQETHGVDYHFVDDETFLTMVDSDELLEHAEVFGRHRYGTPRAPVEAEIAAGRVVILDIDVQGAQQIRTTLPQALMLFIEPPDEGDLDSSYFTVTRRSDTQLQVEQVPVEFTIVKPGESLIEDMSPVQSAQPT